MATNVTIVGNVTEDPELRETKTGTKVANIGVAHNPRYYDQKAGEWKDGTPSFFRLSIWGPQAENVEGAVESGDRVIATGSLRQSRWEDQDGNNRQAVEVDVDAIGLSLEFS